MCTLLTLTFMPSYCFLTPYDPLRTFVHLNIVSVCNIQHMSPCVPYWCLYHVFILFSHPIWPPEDLCSPFTLLVFVISNLVWANVYLTDAYVYNFILLSHPIWPPKELCSPLILLVFVKFIPVWPHIYLNDSYINSSRSQQPSLRMWNVKTFD